MRVIKTGMGNKLFYTCLFTINSLIIQPGYYSLFHLVNQCPHLFNLCNLITILSTAK